MMGGKKNWLIQYWPDIMILIGSFGYLMYEYRYAVSDWQLVDGQIQGELMGYAYNWGKIIPIMIIIIGLDAIIRRWTNSRKTVINGKK